MGPQFFQKFRDKVKRVKETLCSLVDRRDEAGIKEYFEEKQKLDDLLYNEELYWKQRAKAFWLTEGDTNSKYFHAAASKRKRGNHISHLLNNEDILVDNHDDMCELTIDYFKNVFADVSTVGAQVDSTGMNLVSPEQNEKLISTITFEEFTQAVKQMHPDKSAGPDGFSPAFFQHFWKLIGEEIFLSCREWLEEVKFPANLNDTTLVLIPKKDKAERMTELRPIALCNVLYKIIAKVLANRLKVILPGLISENQSAFVPGRSISDNVLVAFETLHYMKLKNKGHEGDVALKLDISKAYDRVNWQYLRQMMLNMGFSLKWIRWIILCVTSVNYMISFNGSLVGPIIPRHGLRQGDPLSPYLFLFCVEGLSHKLKEAAELGQVNGCQITVNAPRITHLLFADDNFLFFKSTVNEANRVKLLLNDYGHVSGQEINYQKSAVFFSANVRRDKQQEIMEILGVNNELRDNKYLGLPSLIGRSKKSVFNFVKEKIWSKVNDWNHKNLSKAGKSVMIKNVALSIPSYSMSCFLLSKTMCLEIERMLNGYWWGSGGNQSKGIRWMAWGKLVVSKTQGGLGFRDLHGFNAALLGKHIWNFCQNPTSLVARLFKARYFSGNHILQSAKGIGSSFIWTGIWEAKEELRKGFRWIVGDGAEIRIFKDPWLKGNSDFCVEENHTSNFRDERVCNYFRPDSKVWDDVRVQQDFSDQDAHLILRTYIPQNKVKDRIAWVGSGTGAYTVKTGYHHWLDRNVEPHPDSDSKGWERIWNL